MARISRKNMKAKVKANTPNGGNGELWSPMGDLNVGDTATIRLVPFEDSITDGFWTIQKMLELKFVNPTDDEKFWSYKVPCLEMYERAGEVHCPVANIVRGVFKEAKALEDAGDTTGAKSLTNAALAHWIRYGYYFQGFVIKGGTEQKDPNSLVPIRVTKSIFKDISNAVTDDEAGFDTLPTGEFDVDDAIMLLNGETDPDMSEEEFLALFVGRNYICRKTKKGEFNNYDTSSWEMKESMLEDEQLQTIAENGLIDLHKFLPNKPTDEQYEVFQEMMQVSLDYALGVGDGEWNPEWEEFNIKPYKGKDDGDSDQTGGKKLSLKERMKAKQAANTTETGDTDSTSSKDSVKTKLNKARGKAKSDETTTDGETSDETTADDAPATEISSDDRMAAMKKRLAAKKLKA